MYNTLRFGFCVKKVGITKSYMPNHVTANEKSVDNKCASEKFRYPFNQRKKSLL